jgi:ATP-dependent helicase/nuclease subunit A
VSTRERFRRDEPDREAIRTDLDSNLLVEAAAGTGKTTSLVDRMLALVREGKAPVDRICAVTFTVKAAAQLKERFQLALERAIPAETDPIRRTRLSDALEAIDRGFIGTIHSFCARLLRERPVEAGVDPEFVELDETEDVLLREEAWERYKQTLFLESHPILAELGDHGMTIDLLRKAFQCLASNPEVRPAAARRREEPRFDREKELVLAFLAEAGKQIPPRAPEAKTDQLQRKLYSALRLKDILDLDRTASLVSLFEKFYGHGKAVQKNWPNAAVAKRLEGEFEALATNVVAPALARWREFLYPIVIEAVEPAVGTFRRLRRERGVLDFADLLLFARDLLRDHPDARREFRKRFTPILVDEFQDTDPIQAEVLLYLTGSSVEEKDWRRLEPEPGSLFVVGDPKQSIYRFRRADIETYDRVRERIVDSGGRVLKLTTNFRSCSEVCDWVNETFSTIFPATASREQAADAPLVPDRPNAGGFSGAVRLDVAAGKSRESVAAVDSVRIASWIRAAIDAKVEIPSAGSRAAEPGDFLILFRYKKMMDLYARELELRGVPYEIAGGGAFSESEDLRDLLPLLEAIVDPDDPVSLAATLRGPLFGVDDDALYRFHRAGGRFHLFVPPPAGTDERILRAIDVLKESFDLSRRLPPAAALARIAGNVGVIAHGGARELGRTRAGNLLKAVSIARVLSADGESFASIVRHLRQLSTASDTEEMSVQPGAVRTVRLMTLHRAKGLEAPIVFLAEPGGEWDAPIDFCVARETEPPEAWLRVLRPDRGDRPTTEEIARPVGWSEREGAELRFQEAENDRLLYVAATRAADLLVVSSAGNDKKSPWAKLAKAIERPLPVLPERSRPESPEAAAPDLSRELADFRRNAETRRGSASQQSYRIVQVTKLTHAAAEATPFRTRTGRGMSWGRVIHRLLEGAMKDLSLDLPLFASNLLAEEERSAEERDAAVDLARAVIASPLWRRALAARRRMTEVPFALQTSSRELGLSDGPPETVLQGAIDLAFEEDAGWIIVDYKSDTVAGNLAELVSFYSPQIELYRRYWQRMTGRPTKAGLFFVQSGDEVWTDAG